MRPCPFCPGHEESTPPALETYGRDGRWVVRIVPNLYPGLLRRRSARGAQPRPGPRPGPGQRHPRGAGVLARARRRAGPTSTTATPGSSWPRCATASRSTPAPPNVRYTQAIVNHGREAGASLSHPHGQLLGMPFVPGEILDEERAFGRFEGGCILCATVEAEVADGLARRARRRPCRHRLPVLGRLALRAARDPAQRTTPTSRSRPRPTSRRSGGPCVTCSAGLRALLGDVAYNLVFHTAPHRARRPLPLARPHLAEAACRSPGSSGAPACSSTSSPPEFSAQELRKLGAASVA